MQKEKSIGEIGKFQAFRWCYLDERTNWIRSCFESSFLMRSNEIIFDKIAEMSVEKGLGWAFVFWLNFGSISNKSIISSTSLLQEFVEFCWLHTLPLDRTFLWVELIWGQLNSAEFDRKKPITGSFCQFSQFWNLIDIFKFRIIQKSLKHLTKVWKICWVAFGKLSRKKLKTVNINFEFVHRCSFYVNAKIITE